MSLKIGENAPLFTLIDNDRKKVSLEDLKGKNVVLHFFPFAFSGTCNQAIVFDQR